MLFCLCGGCQDDADVIRQARERDEEMVKRTLMALNDMKIKFPGKSEEEAEYILDKVSAHQSTSSLSSQCHRAPARL